MSERKFTVGSLMNTQRAASPIKELKSEESHPKDKDPVVTVVQDESTYSIKMTGENQTLLEAALEQKQMLNHKCKKGTCGQCEVKVTDGLEALSSPTDAEKQKLEDKLTKDHRLACQAVLR